MTFIYCFYLRIDKFLEGYSSDGEELPVNNKNNVLDKCESPVHHKKTELDVGKTLIAINKSDLVSIWISIFFIVEYNEYLLTLIWLFPRLFLNIFNSYLLISIPI